MDLSDSDKITGQLCYFCDLITVYGQTIKKNGLLPLKNGKTTDSSLISQTYPVLLSTGAVSHEVCHSCCYVFAYAATHVMH